MYCRYTLIVLLGIAASCNATSGPETCTTYFGRLPRWRHVPTSTKTVTTTVTPKVVVTSTPSTTTTLQPITSTSTTTSTSTVTSTTQSTDTETTTTTLTTTSTVIGSTSTFTSTSTVSASGTTSTSTTTTLIAATAGFTPIQSSAPDTSYSGDYGGPQNKRETRLTSALKLPFTFGKTVAECRRFPQKVNCVVTKTVVARPTTITKTASTTQTFTSTPSPVTTTTTSTVTTTTTSALEPASTTVTTSTTTTITAFSTPSTTITTTSTTTIVTTVASTQSNYAQCTSSSNYADTVAGTYGMNVQDPTGNDNFNVVDGAVDATSCCNLCASEANCGISAWDPDDTSCYISPGCAGSVTWQVYSQSVDFIFNNGCNQAVDQ